MKYWLILMSSNMKNKILFNEKKIVFIILKSNQFPWNDSESKICNMFQKEAFVGFSHQQLRRWY